MNMRTIAIDRNQGFWFTFIKLQRVGESSNHVLSQDAFIFFNFYQEKTSRIEDSVSLLEIEWVGNWNAMFGTTFQSHIY